MEASGELETRARMTRLWLAFAIALLGLPAQAGAPAVSHSYSAEFYLPGCKEFIAGKMSFLGGRCVGAAEVLDALSQDTKAFCAPEGTDNLNRTKVIVAYIEAHPDRTKEDFRLLANEAMAKAWPCKN